MEQLIIFRGGKYYSYINNDWVEYDLKSNKSNNKEASEDTVASFNKDIYNGRILFIDNNPFIYNPNANQGFRWKSWNDNSKKGGKTANKSDQNVLDKSLKVQTFSYLTKLRNKKSPETNATKTLQPVINTIKNASDGEINSGTKPDQPQPTSSPQPNVSGVKPSKRQSNISSQPSANKINDTKPTYQKVKNNSETSSIVTNDEFKGSSSNVILDVLKSIDKNILGMSSTLKTLNKTLITFAERQRTLEQIAENFTNAKATDHQQKSNQSGFSQSAQQESQEPNNQSNNSDDSGINLGDAVGAAAGYKMGKGGHSKTKTGSSGKKLRKPNTNAGKSASRLGKFASKMAKKSGASGVVGKTLKNLGRIGKVGSIVKGGLIGGLGAYALDEVSEGLEARGHDKSAAITGIASNAMGYASIGAMVGSAVPGIGTGIGAAVGGLIGVGEGIYKNAGKFFTGREDKRKQEYEKFLKSKGFDKDGKQINAPQFSEEEFAKKDPENYKKFKVYQADEEKRLTADPTNNNALDQARQNAIGKFQTQIQHSGAIKTDTPTQTDTKYSSNKSEVAPIKIDDNKFAAKDPVKFQKFAEYREQQMQSYVNQIPSDIPPEERQVAVQKAQQQAQNDAEKQFEINQEKPSAEKVPSAEPQQNSSREIPKSSGSNEGYSGKFEEGLGELSSKYEGKYGTISTGEGDPGGISYGKYQFASKKGGLDKFFQVNPEYAKEFAGLTRGTKEFGDKWKQLAKTPEFQQAQEKSAQEYWYKPAAEHAKTLGYKMDDRGVREAVFSGSIQHGQIKKVLSTVAKETPGFEKMSGEEQLKAYYAYREKYAVKHAPKNEKGIRNRYGKELKDAVKMSRESGDANKNAENTIDKQNEMIQQVQDKNKTATRLPSDERAQAAIEAQNEMIDNTQKSGSAKILQEAEQQKGWNETDNESQLRAYIKEGGHSSNQVKGDSNAWCARYVGGVLGHAGYKGTGKDNAKSYLNYGQGVWSKGSQDFSGVKAGDVAVFNRDGGKQGKGHVAIVKSVDPKTGRITYVGGNQSGKGGGEVTESSQNINKKGSELLAIRRPDQIKEDGQPTKQENVETQRRPGDTSQVPKGFEQVGPEDQNLPDIQDVKSPVQESATQLQPTQSNQSYTPMMPENLGMRANLPSASGDNLGMGSTGINNAKDMLNVGGGGGGSPGASGKPLGGTAGGGGGGAPGGPGMANKSNDESGANIMSIGIGLRTDESTIQRCQYSCVKIV